MIPLVHLTVQDVLLIHDAVIGRYGGTRGVRDRGLLESAVAQPRQSAFQADAYPTPAEKAAAYAFFISENQPFLNKRTAAVAMIAFLRLNGLDLNADEEQLYQVMMSLGDKTWTRQQFFAWVAEHAAPEADR